MRISDKTIEQVRQYKDIVGVISDYVSLKKRGRNYIGLCPFHSEKTPSFTVSPERRIFHCFGCHESGDLISFVQKVDNLSFVETIQSIASRVGIEVEEDESSSYNDPQSELRRQLADIMLLFSESCISKLDEHPQAKDYFLKRGISQETITEFCLGVCPADFNVLEFFKEQGFELDTLMKSGLFYKSDSGAIVPRFKNRLTFPVSDYQGRTIGMGGRVYLPNQPGAKYVNSEETIVYNKRQLLYGLNKAKRGIKQFGYALLVEGYMDVIMAHQFGYTHAVASMGTALTAEQAQKIKRFTDIVYLAMDSDDAGQSAMERSYEVLSQYGITTYVVYLDSKDPADVLRDQGVDAFQSLLENAVPVIQFQFDRALKRHDVSKIERVAKIIDEIIPLLKLEKETVIQRHYVQQFCKKLNVDEELVLAKLANNSYNIPKKKFHFDKNKKSKLQIAEECLIAISANSLESRQYVQNVVKTEDFTVQHHSEIFSLLLGTQLEGNSLLETIQDGSMKSLLCQLLVESNDLLVSKNAQFVDDCIKVVSSQKTAQRILEIKEKIKQLEEVGDQEQLGGLLVELQQLNKKG